MRRAHQMHEDGAVDVAALTDAMHAEKGARDAAARQLLADRAVTENLRSDWQRKLYDRRAEVPYHRSHTHTYTHTHTGSPVQIWQVLVFAFAACRHSWTSPTALLLPCNHGISCTTANVVCNALRAFSIITTTCSITA